MSATTIDTPPTVRDFTDGQRVQTLPHTDTYMSGDVYGIVEKIGRKYIYVRMARSGRLVKLMPEHIGDATPPAVVTEPAPAAVETVSAPLEPTAAPGARMRITGRRAHPAYRRSTRKHQRAARRTTRTSR